MKKRSRFLFLTTLLIGISSLFSCGGSSDPVYYSVIYEYNDYMHTLDPTDPTSPYYPEIFIDGEWRTSEFVKENEYPHKPEVEYEGNPPEGWYADPLYTEVFNFDAPITKSTHVWANWKKTSELKGVRFLISEYDINHGDFFQLTDELTKNILQPIPSTASYYDPTFVIEDTGVVKEVTTVIGTYQYAAKIGSTKLTATVWNEARTESFSASMTINVVKANRVSNLEFTDPTSQSKTTINLNDTTTYDLKWKLTGEDTSKDPDNTNVIFKVDDETKGAVDENGIVTFNAVGTLKVYIAALNSNEETPKWDYVIFDINNVKPLISIDLNPSTVILFDKDSERTDGKKSQEITITYNPEDANNKDLIWTSSPSSIATVSNTTTSGDTTNTINAGKAPKDGEKIQTATVTASQGESISDTVTVQVVNPIYSLKLSEADTYTSENPLHMKIGATSNEDIPSTYASNLIVSPSLDDVSSCCKNLVWESSDTNVATVDTNGIVKAVGSGTAKISVKTNNDSSIDPKVFTSEYYVKVADTVDDISIDHSYVFLSSSYKTTETLKLELDPTTLEDWEINAIQWSSSDTSIVKIDGSATGKSVTITIEDCANTGTTNIVAAVEDIYGNIRNTTCSVTSFSTEPTYEKLKFNETSGNYSVRGGMSCAGDVVIPSVYPKTSESDGNVISIEKGGFTKLAISSVYVSNTITSIGESAFSGCTSLSIINIPSSVSSIGDLAFSSCSALEVIIVDSEKIAKIDNPGNLFTTFSGKKKKVRVPKNFAVGSILSDTSKYTPSIEGDYIFYTQNS